jgi:hypothetical protein
MAVSEIGRPFQGDAWYWVEATYGSGESATTLPISKYIQNISIGTGDKGKDVRSIKSAIVAERIIQTNEPVLSIEYNPQVGDTLIEDTVDRDACCMLQSLAFCVGANICLGGDDSTYYYIVGAKPSSVKISGSKNEAYSVSIDFQAQSVTTVEVGSAPSELTGAIMQFNLAGEITKTGGWVVDTDHIAFITNAINITVDHQLTGHTDHDSINKSFLVEGTLDVSGTVDITLDGGGGMHVNEVLDFTDFTITVNMGGAGAVKLTLPDCNWQNSNVKIDAGGDAMIESAPFVVTPSNCSSIVSTV